MAKQELVQSATLSASVLTGPQMQYQRHQATIDKLQRDITSQRQQREAVLARFMREILPLEHQYLQTLYDKTNHLLSFSCKKSLGKYDREALFAWAGEEFDELVHHPFNEHLDLNSLYRQFRDFTAEPKKTHSQADIDAFRHEINTVFGDDRGLSDDELTDMMDDPDRIFATLNRFFGEESVDAEEGFFDDNAHNHHTENTPHALPDTPLKSPEITRMYKKLASQLHPDREPDPAIKAEKHVLMVALTKARKANDIWAIFELYRQHVDPDFMFSDADIPAINALLLRRIQALQSELAEIKDPGTLSGMVWDKLGARTEKAMKTKFKKHADMLQRMMAEHTRQQAELRSLTVLREYLKPWRSELEQARSFSFY